MSQIDTIWTALELQEMNISYRNYAIHTGKCRISSIRLRCVRIRNVASVATNL